MFRLDGEIALITGGGTGLGLAMSQCLAKAGAKVVLVGRRESVLQEAAQSIGELASYEVFDITEIANIPALVSRITEKVGEPTILINNAGVHLKKPAVETTDEEFDTVLTTHVKGSFALTRAVAPAMIAKKRGSVIFIASMTSLFGLPLTVAYSAAKSAYLGLVRTLATEFSPHGVRVNGIAPGFITSDITKRAFQNDPARLQKVLGRTPMGKMGEAEDIGYAAVYLASNEAKYVTGVILPIDCGTSIGF
jgi:NAD(P)-dependent dehydrogenase (short-subunit alcohol dehydrogenase family)